MLNEYYSVVVTHVFVEVWLILWYVHNTLQVNLTLSQVAVEEEQESL